MGLKNKSRGYQQLRVWRDSIEFYRLTSHVFRKLPYELKRVGKLVESLERKKLDGDWIDNLIVKETNAVYEELD